MSDLAHISKERGLSALSDATYVHNRTMLYIFGTFQVSTLIFAVFITALKPWKKNT